MMQRFKLWLAQHWMILVVVILSLGLILAAGIWVIFKGYSLSWTGFGGYTTPEGMTVRGKTLWDWLQLFIIPISLVLGLFFLYHEERKSKLQRAEVLANREREIATDRLQEAAFQSYLCRMTDLLLKEKLRTTDNEEVREVARLQTITALRGLDANRKGMILLFLMEAGLITEKPIINLTGADLTKVMLAVTNLSGANLFRVDLTKANLRLAKLNTVNLAGANMIETNLEEANLEEANLVEALLASAMLNRAILKGAHLKNAILLQADLIQADLSGTDLTGSDLTEANLTGAYLRGADLSGAKLTGACLKGADLTDANLTEANLTKVSLDGAYLRGADLSGTHLRGADLNGANLAGANLARANLTKAKVSEKQLAKAKSLRGTIMPDGTQHI